MLLSYRLWNIRTKYLRPVNHALICMSCGSVIVEVLPLHISSGQKHTVHRGKSKGSDHKSCSL